MKDLLQPPNLDKLQLLKSIGDNIKGKRSGRLCSATDIWKLEQLKGLIHQQQATEA